MNVRKYPYHPDYAVAPGETVRETMESLGLTQREFAMRLDTSCADFEPHLPGNAAHHGGNG